VSSESKYEIPFTEYVRPRGRKRDLLWPTTSRELYAKSRAIIAAGFVFEVERLEGNVIGATITHNEAGDMAYCLAYNDKRLTASITSMIEGFDIDKQQHRVEEMLRDD